MKPIKCQSAELNKKRQYYIKLMKEIDDCNKDTSAQLERVEKFAGKLRAQLNKGRQLREKAKHQISRYKQTIKNKNRADNGSEVL